MDDTGDGRAQRLLSRAAFGAAIARALRGLRGIRSVTSTASEVVIEAEPTDIGVTLHLTLANFYRHYERSGDLQQEIDTVLATWRDNKAVMRTDEANLDSMLDRLLPKIEIAATIARADRGAPERRVWRPWKHGLAVALVVDSPSSVAYLTSSLVRSLGLSVEELYARALANLDQIPLDLVYSDSDVGPSRFATFSRSDGFAVSCVLRAGAIRAALAPRGVLWAACPTSLMLMLCDAVDRAAFQAFRETAETAYKLDTMRRLLPAPFRL